jgi:hypothetical protein
MTAITTNKLEWRYKLSATNYHIFHEIEFVPEQTTICFLQLMY